MIMASNSQGYFRTGRLHPETVMHLQRLVLLNADSRDAYRAAAALAQDARLIALAEHTERERHNQAVTLQNLLWSDGNESTSRFCMNTVDRRLFDRTRPADESSQASIIQRLLDIDDYVYSCYEKVLSKIQGRGIRQLLSEQATPIRELRTSLTELLTDLDAPISSMETTTSPAEIRETCSS
jgi:hypothetical protein